MRKFQKIKQENWFSLAFAGCIVTVFYLLLSHFDSVAGGFKTLLGYFSSVFTGIILAYLMNSPAKFFRNTIFKKIKSEKKRWNVSVLLAVITVFAFLWLSMMILVPQLLESVSIFLTNLPTYAASMHTWLTNLGLSKTTLGTIFGNETIQAGSSQIIDTAVNYLLNNSGTILTQSASAGQQLFNFIIAFILSLYFMMDKTNVMNACKRFMRAVQKPAFYTGTIEYLKKCDLILSRYVVYNIIDSLIVGGVNAVFMTVCGIPYIGLISFVVGITNLIPTFGPVIGAVIGGFILLMANPKQVILFLIFTLILQTCDGYVIKPRLFGNSLGVSGMLIIVGVIVGGKIAGIAGILLATPVVAILDFTWADMILPRLEARRTRLNEAAAISGSDAAEPSEGAADSPEPPPQAQKKSD